MLDEFYSEENQKKLKEIRDQINYIKENMKNAQEY